VKGLLAATAGAVVLMGLLTGCSSPKLPAASADPVSVTKVYLAAAKANKCDVTKALTLSSTWAWCKNPTLKSYTVAEKAEVVPVNPGGTKETCVSTTVTSSASGEQEAMDGERDWSFCFTKTGSGWRLADQGQG
jgi:hypothetical protein